MLKEHANKIRKKRPDPTEEVNYFLNAYFKHRRGHEYGLDCSNIDKNAMYLALCEWRCKDLVGSNPSSPAKESIEDAKTILKELYFGNSSAPKDEDA